MASDRFNLMWKRVLRDHKHSIVRSAMRGLKDKGVLLFCKYPQLCWRKLILRLAAKPALIILWGKT